MHIRFQFNSQNVDMNWLCIPLMSSQMIFKETLTVT